MFTDLKSKCMKMRKDASLLDFKPMVSSLSIKKNLSPAQSSKVLRSSFVGVAPTPKKEPEPRMTKSMSLKPKSRRGSLLSLKISRRSVQYLPNLKSTPRSKRGS